MEKVGWTNHHVWLQLPRGLGIFRNRNTTEARGGENGKQLGGVARRCCDGRTSPRGQDCRYFLWKGCEGMEWPRVFALALDLVDGCIGLFNNYIRVSGRPGFGVGRDLQSSSAI
uniref:Uncharacterized protein n=1 Tax=Bionectria ochroleuca TaxID=29856 RepID=A0A8H7NG76_BIOOC